MSGHFHNNCTAPTPSPHVYQTCGLTPFGGIVARHVSVARGEAARAQWTELRRREEQQEAEAEGCGDGAIQAGELCDDGNSDPGDGCAAADDHRQVGDRIQFRGYGL